MTYIVKEIFLSLQGEGARTGRAAVFCRFSGCNLWSGRESDRALASCGFCDTDFVGIDGRGGGRYLEAEELALAIRSRWPAKAQSPPLVVCTGGEPLLQLDAPLVGAFRAAGFEVAVETNGSRPAPAGIDWLTVSPKAGVPLVLRRGDELKLVYPQPGAEPERYQALDFEHFFLQPLDGPERKRNTELAIRYCLERPQWRLSLQIHKLLGIP